MGTFAAGGTVSMTPASIPSHWDGKQHCWWEDPKTDNNKTRRQSMAGYRWEVLTTNDPAGRVTLWNEIVSRALAYYCWTYILVLVDKSRLGYRLLTYGRTCVRLVTRRLIFPRFNTHGTAVVHYRCMQNYYFKIYTCIRHDVLMRGSRHSFGIFTM